MLRLTNSSCSSVPAVEEADVRPRHSPLKKHTGSRPHGKSAVADLLELIVLGLLIGLAPGLDAEVTGGTVACKAALGHGQGGNN